jgi:arylsulfotransferase ASST
MLPGVKRAALALVAFSFLLTACDDNKSASKTTSTTEAKGPPPPTQSYKSRPDLKPPPVEILTSSPTAPGYVFFAPKMKVVQAGPMIIDNSGQTVWFHPLKTKGVSDFKVQTYHGQPVLTWWRGRAPMGVGNGYYVISDQTYREVGRVYAGHKFAGDIHDFLITPRNTALVPVYHQVKLDLTQYGGPKEGRIFDGIVQEIDIPTGRVLFEWHSYPEVGLDESFAPPPSAKKGAKAAPWDYFHLNSIDVADDGNYILSARNTHTIYKLNRDTGKLMWRMGGKKSDFKMGAGTNFAWQHDARQQDDGTITLFDNGAAPPVEKFTRILRIRADEGAKTATLVTSYKHPENLLAPFEGSAQFLSNGNVFVGWGAIPYFTEFDAQGRVLLDARFGKGTAKITEPDQDADTYRAFRFVWQGHPTDRPAVVMNGGTLYVSWNGATEVKRWQVLAGKDVGNLTAIASAPKSGFETSIPVSTSQDFVAVRALDGNGAVLGTSKLVAAKKPSSSR